MKRCAYFGCTEPAAEELEDFVYCLDHVAFLHNMMDLDTRPDNSGFNTVAYCLASLNTKACVRDEILF
jgi:hypothetical protein